MNVDVRVLFYDASGNPISKAVSSSGATVTTRYIRDASGNVMSIYVTNNSINSGALTQMETHLYGSSRLGLWNINRNVGSLSSIDYSGFRNSFVRGNKLFELSNHLGNVLVTVSDKKIGHNGGSGTIDYNLTDVVTANDYYPFGMLMPGRSYAQVNKYRYGFNGKENDNDVKGEGNQQDYGMRIYDPRLGRFSSVDPLSHKYSWYTPYQFAGNTPIQATDLDGSEEYHYTMTLDKQGKTHLHLDNIEYEKKHSFLGFEWSTKILSERAHVKYDNKNYYIGYAGSYGRGNENGMELFTEFKKNPVAQLFPLLFLNEDQSYNVEQFSMAVQIQSNTVMYGQLTEKAWYTRTVEDAKTSTVYRTQGGQLPNASRNRILINKDGSINIKGDEMLFVTLNDKAHQLYFYQKRGGSNKGAEIVSFQIPQSLADEIIANGIPLAQGKAYPDKPQISDPTKSSSAYGLPRPYIEKLRQQAIKGSAKIETPEGR